MPSCPCGSESTHRRSMRRLNATHWYKNRPSKCSPLSDRAFKHLCLAPFRTVDPLFVFLLRLAGLHPPRIQLRRLEERRPVQLSSNHPHRLVRHQLSSSPRQHPLRREHDVPNCTREKDGRCKAKRLYILKGWSWPRKLSSASGHSSGVCEKAGFGRASELDKRQTPTRNYLPHECAKRGTAIFIGFLAYDVSFCAVGLFPAPMGDAERPPLCIREAWYLQQERSRISMTI